MNEDDDFAKMYADVLIPHPSYTALDALIEMFEEEEECENSRSTGS